MEKNLSILSDLCLIANNLDKKGFYKEASNLDNIISNFCLESDLLSEAALKDSLVDAAKSTGRAATKAISTGAKALRWTVWDKGIKPYTKQIAGTFAAKPLGALLLAITANMSGYYGFSPAELSDFLRKPENAMELAYRVSSLVDLGGHFKYEVKPGDNLHDIIYRNYPELPRDRGVILAAIDYVAEYNDIENSELIRPGQIIKLPKSLDSKIIDAIERAVNSIEYYYLGKRELTPSLKMDLISAEEGVEAKEYSDGRQNPTIGIGHLLTKEEISSGTIEIDGEKVNWKEGLSDQQILDLYKQDKASHDLKFKQALDEMRKEIPEGKIVDYDDLSESEIFALEDATFNLGLKGMKELIAETYKVEGEVTGRGMANALSYYLADEGIYARRLAQILWSRGIFLNKYEIRSIVEENSSYSTWWSSNRWMIKYLAKRNRDFCRELIFGLTANPNIDTVNEFAKLVIDVQNGKRWKRWGTGVLEGL